ncbi:hypothetical protein GQ42DRAFT_161914 [Ramicandelaber brevisporus]|nr:hypothetical protein GQ42DRAFT_161914 [Ramicandelaber brevisporus]
MKITAAAVLSTGLLASVANAWSFKCNGGTKDACLKYTNYKWNGSSCYGMLSKGECQRVCRVACDMDYKKTCSGDCF